MAPKDDQTVTLLQALAVTAEITGTELSEAAARVMASELLVYPHQQVIVALDRCRRELKARLTLAAILERLDDGRPGPNEAWGMIPQDEAGSVVWTDEMAHAFGIAQPLIAAGQIVQASMTFREVYADAVARARADRIPPRWTPSLGTDKRAREAAIETATRLGRIGQAHAAKLLPAPQSATVTAMLEAPRSTMPDDVRKQLAAFTAKLRASR